MHAFVSVPFTVHIFNPTEMKCDLSDWPAFEYYLVRGQALALYISDHIKNFFQSF